MKIRDIRVRYEDLAADLCAAVDYWQTLKGDRIGPQWQEFDLLKLPLALLRTTVVVDCFEDENGTNFHYRYCGSGLRSIHTVELTGKTPDDMPIAALSQYVKSAFHQVQETKVPVFSVYGTYVVKGFDEFLQVARLPLSEDGKQVSSIISVISYLQDDFVLSNMFEQLQKEEHAEDLGPVLSGQ